MYTPEEERGGGGGVSLIRNMTAQLHAHPVGVTFTRARLAQSGPSKELAV